jgi:hypothetical protein
MMDGLGDSNRRARRRVLLFIAALKGGTGNDVIFANGDPKASARPWGRASTIESTAGLAGRW